MSLWQRVKQEEPLANHSTFGIGGPATYFLTVRTLEEMKESFSIALDKGLEVFILGKGSNCLFDDRGFKGLVILNKIDFCEIQGGEVFVGAGYSFSLLGRETAKLGFKGLEFASGIPATVGGAVFMNAGASGGQCADYLEEVVFLDLQGNKRIYQKSDLSFTYRTSPFQSMKGAIISARFKLEPCLLSREKQKKLIEHRIQTQPMNEKSAGCLFRNPSPQLPAGRLIEESGLKGYSIGGAKVSEKHANYIVSQGGSCQDVKALVAYVQQRVKREKNIDLELEIRYIPYAQDISSS